MNDQSAPVVLCNQVSKDHNASLAKGPASWSFAAAADFGRAPMIDNRWHVYIPVPLRCGVQTRCRPEVLTCSPLVLEEINSDLTSCLQILPRSTHRLIRRTKIWVNASYTYGLLRNPKILTHTTTHHHESWLIWHQDRPGKALGIEIYNCSEFRKMRLHWNGCGLLLHELCHLIHQHALTDGLENETVKQAYRWAERSGLYDHVLRRDWAGLDKEYDLAYAMVDQKEFFAEMSVTYWCCSYEVLDARDPTKMQECSPPFLDPVVQARCGPLLSTRDENDQMESTNQLLLIKLKRFLGQLLYRETSHCNKFYPFTRGQLKHLDATCFHTMDALWNEIAQWDDPDRDTDDCHQGCCWLPNQSMNRRTGVDVGLLPDTVDL